MLKICFLTLSTRQAAADDIPKFHKMFKNCQIIEFHYLIWNKHEKCIEISTNMPSIGSVIIEIDLGIWERFLKILFCI